uniref:Uncharacterized protein n=1 Tax=Glossina austeni TaxID=7395 RepID=A0A1A9UGN8_GLOAU
MEKSKTKTSTNLLAWFRYLPQKHLSGKSCVCSKMKFTNTNVNPIHHLNARGDVRSHIIPIKKEEELIHYYNYFSRIVSDFGGIVKNFTGSINLSTSECIAVNQKFKQHNLEKLTE